MIILFCIDSFLVASDFWVNRTNLRIDFEIRYASKFAPCDSDFIFIL